MAEPLRKVFLRAEWRELVMLNYEIDPAALARYVPNGTELDFYEGRCFASMVGFRFLRTRVRGVWIPFHENFPEVNLRIYVRRKADDGWRRGVVFVREIVPRFAIATIARTLYNEPYSAMPMRLEVTDSSAAYFWKSSRGWNEISASGLSAPTPIPPGSQEEFITEHYWGYNAQRNGSTMEYQVTHPRWQVRAAESAKLQCDIEGLYGKAFVPWLSVKPASAFVAVGSAVTVSTGFRF